MEYRVLALADIVEKDWQGFLPSYYEHNLVWIRSTASFVVDKTCYLHSLWDNNKLVAALPLYQQKNQYGVVVLKNLMSFYSTQAPLMESPDFKGSGNILLKKIFENSRWHMFEIGPLLNAPDYLGYLSAERAIQDNWYCPQITSSEHYFSERPSRLLNTLKRKGRQLDKFEHQYLVADQDNFERLFFDYLSIYQQSWKGQEFSVDFIRTVCEKALSENKLCLVLLYIEDKPAAGQIWFIERGCASIFKLAYVPEYRSSYQWVVYYLLSWQLSMLLSNFQVE